jgi:hypothetical protein
MSYGLVFLLLEFMPPPLMLPFEAFRLLEFMPPPLILPFEALWLLEFMPLMLEFAPPVLLAFEPPMPVFVVLDVPVLVEVLLVVVVVLVFEVVVLAFPFVLSVAQPVQKAATASKAKSAKVLRIEFFSCNPMGQVVKSCARVESSSLLALRRNSAKCFSDVRASCFEHQPVKRLTFGVCARVCQ